ncbi:MAG: Rid family hydrolase [Gemmatimonadota bacterium]|nr:Rid family hydrolase [Gemmatimonadota bacterium]
MKFNTMLVTTTLIMAIAHGPVGAQELEREFIDPAGVFTQVVTVADRGVKTLYVSGQVGQGADLAAHVESAFQGVVRRLESAGASTSDVVKIRIFVKDFDPADYSIISQARLRTFSDEDTWPTSTMVGIQELFTAQLRVEIEAVAVIADPAVPGANVTIERIGASRGFSQAVVVTANGTKTIYVSGQVGQGDGLAEQSTSVLEAVAQRLEAAGATIDDLVKIVTYISDYTAEDRRTFGAARTQAFGSEDLPASTLLGVQSLVTDQYEIEVDAIAVVSDGAGGGADTEFIGPTSGFSQAVTTQGSGAKTIYISGQVGRAGESLATQADQAYASLRRQLEASGATPADLVKITVYMADYSQADAAVLGAAQQNGFPAENLPATTLIGVASLYSDTALIEIEGMAVVP